MSRHVIETLNWVCHSTDPHLGMTQQQRLSAFVQGRGGRVLEQVFDRLSPHGETWRIDQLEVDLGQMGSDADVEVWAGRLESAVETALQRLRHEAAPGTVSRATGKPRRDSDVELDNFLYYLEHGHLHWSMPALGNGDMADWLARLARHMGPRLWSSLQRLPHAERSLRRLSHITPWHGLQALLASRHAGLAQALDALDGAVLEPLRAQGRLRAYQIAQVRQAWRVAGLYALWGNGGSALGTVRMQGLLTTLGETLVAQLGEGGAGEQSGGFAAAAQTAGTSDLLRSLLLGMHVRLFGTLPEADDAAAGASQASGDGVARTEEDGYRLVLNVAWHESLRQFSLAHQGEPVVRAAGFGLTELQTYLLDYSLAYLGAGDHVPQDHVAWQGVWQGALLALAEGNDVEPPAALRADGTRLPASAPERARIRTNRNNDGSISPADDYPGQEAIYIANAGLVLLALYAPRLFSMFDLLKDDQFVDDAARHRAVHSLVYLTDGDAGSEEHEWVLNKMLCGLPIDEPVPPVMAIDDMRPALDSLLVAIIGHWGALGGTSPEGLRRTFLQRIGRLVEHETLTGEHWRLKVQPGPFDVLLDRLPWSYGIIKLPWMKGAIHVDWR